MGGMDLWVAYPIVFKQLDAYINQPRDPVQRQALKGQFQLAHPATPPPGTTGIPLLPGWSNHFTMDWIGNPPTQGGRYWPYLRDVSVGRMLQCALQTSVKVFVDSKQQP